MRVGVARFADGIDQPIAQANIGLVDARMVQDQRVGDDGIHCPARARDLALPHAVADDFTAAKLHLFAVGGQVVFNFDDDVGIAKAHAVAGGGAIHSGVIGAGNTGGHYRSPITLALKP